MLPTLNCYGRGRSDCASSPVNLDAVGALSRCPVSLNSCASEPSALLRPAATAAATGGRAARSPSRAQPFGPVVRRWHRALDLLDLRTAKKMREKKLDYRTSIILDEHLKLAILSQLPYRRQQLPYRGTCIPLTLRGVRCSVNFTIYAIATPDVQKLLKACGSQSASPVARYFRLIPMEIGGVPLLFRPHGSVFDP